MISSDWKYSALWRHEKIIYSRKSIRKKLEKIIPHYSIHSKRIGYEDEILIFISKYYDKQWLEIFGIVTSRKDHKFLLGW